MKRLALTIGVLALAGAATAQDRSTWVRPAKPFHVIGPVYSVGSEGLAVYLIKTRAGAIVLDGGVPEIGAQVEANIKALGVPLKDVKILLNSHAHYDHSGALAQLKRDTGATLVASEGDKWALENGKYLGSEGEHGFDFPPVKVDRTVKDGETVTLGEVTLKANLTPGHTKGCTSWTLPIVEAGARHTAIFFCSASVAANRLAPKEQYPGIVADYRATFAKAKTIDADIYLAPHAEFFDMAGKQARKAPGSPNPFIKPGEFQAAIARFEADFGRELARQQRAAP